MESSNSSGSEGGFSEPEDLAKQFENPHRAPTVEPATFESKHGGVSSHDGFETHAAGVDGNPSGELPISVKFVEPPEIKAAVQDTRPAVPSRGPPVRWKVGLAVFLCVYCSILAVSYSFLPPLRIALNIEQNPGLFPLQTLIVVFVVVFLVFFVFVPNLVRLFKHWVTQRPHPDCCGRNKCGRFCYNFWVG